MARKTLKQIILFWLGKQASHSLESFEIEFAFFHTIMESKIQNVELRTWHDYRKNKTVEYVAKTSCKFSPTCLYLVGLMIFLIKEKCSFILARILLAKLWSPRGLSDDSSVVAFQAISLPGQRGILSHTHSQRWFSIGFSEWFRNSKEIKYIK